MAATWSVRVTVAKISSKEFKPLILPEAVGRSMDMIRTARLVLRRAQADDLVAMHRVMSDPVAMRYWSTPPHSSLEDTRKFLDNMISAPATESDEFVLEFQGEVIGKAGCWRIPEIGFILHPAHWKKGLARESISALLPRIYDRFSISAITADVDPRNEPCLNLLMRLGFEETGRADRTWLVGTEWCDSVYLVRKRSHTEQQTNSGIF